jgi:hypothetical protein
MHAAQRKMQGMMAAWSTIDWCLTVHTLAAVVAAGGVLLLVRHSAAAGRVSKQRLYASKVPGMHVLCCDVVSSVAAVLALWRRAKRNAR